MIVTPQECRVILGDVAEIARRTGQMLLRGLMQPKDIRFKGAVDLATEWDLRAEEQITEALRRKYPEIQILAEEGAPHPQGAAEDLWIVDPVDGTTNFAHGHPVFAVSIALKDERGIALGVVELPALKKTFQACREGGTTCNDVRVSVSSVSELGSALLGTGFPYDRRTAHDDNTREFFKFVKKGQGVRRSGSAAADLAFVACGIYDAFWEPKLFPWDIAAGMLLVEEAGGRVTDYAGLPLDLFRGWIVASNGHIHDDVLAVLAAVRKSL